MNVAKYFLSFFVAKEEKEEEFVIVEPDIPKKTNENKRLESDSLGSSELEFDQKQMNRKIFKRGKKTKKHRR